MSKLKAQKTDWHQIGRFLVSANRKLAAANKILAIDEEACLQQAYEAMLRASLGYMQSCGVRVRSQAGHHIAIIEFVEKNLGKEQADLIAIFDRMRKQRNRALYDTTGFISHTDAEAALEAAREFLAVIRGEVEKKRKQKGPI